jgi:anaerobic magnesium-protoporphyrin IX monomethyl ester cyclase
VTDQPAVLIVRPQPSRGLGAFYRNLGLTMAASHVQARGMRAQLLDLSFDHLEDANPEARAALFSLYIDDFSAGIAAAAELRDVSPKLTTFVGGPHVTLLGQESLQLSDAFDVIGVGDCLPNAMPAVSAAAYGQDKPRGLIIAGPDQAARMDSLAPDYRIWPDDRYFPVFPLEASRGCRQRCPFCTDPVIRRGLALSPASRAMSTIRSLVADHGPVCLRFVDSSMSSLGDSLQELLDALIEAELPVRWSAYAYPHDITQQLAGKLAKAGCIGLFLGIESLADGVRVGKHHTKNPDEVARAVDALHANGIFVHGNFIIGLPGETAATVEQTLNAIPAIGFDSVGGGPFYLTPGSTFERSAGRFGIEVTDPAWRLRQHVNFYDSQHEYFRTATLTQPQIRELARWFRQEIETQGKSCWNLSDYAAICWLSVGGNLTDLAILWRRCESDLSPEQQHVISVLKEKTDAGSVADAAGFVELTRRVALTAHSAVR